VIFAVVNFQFANMEKLKIFSATKRSLVSTKNL